MTRDTDVFSADGRLKHTSAPEVGNHKMVESEHVKGRFYKSDARVCSCGFRIRGDGHAEGRHHQRQLGGVRHKSKR